MPLIGVGALIVHQERIVLVQRGAPPSYGEWSIPGGLVDVGETLRGAAKREAFEETGLTVQPLELVELIERIVPDESGRFKYHYVIADFLCTFEDGELTADSDADGAIWASESVLGNLALAPMTEEVVRKALQMASRR